MSKPMHTSTSLFLKENLYKAGFDICHGPFSPELYNDLLESEGLIESGVLQKLPEECTIIDDDDDDDDDVTTSKKTKTKAYLIGNTKHLWPIFLRWFQEENEKLRRRSEMEESTSAFKDENNNDGHKSCDDEYDEILIEDPLDTYEQTAIEKVVREQFVLSDEKKSKSNHNNNNNNNNVYYELYWSSDLEASRMVSMARVASCTGFSYLDNDTHLSIHSKYGTWHSYRAVLLLSEEEEDEDEYCIPTSSTEEKLPSPLSSKEAIDSKLAFDEALRISTAATSKQAEEGAANDNAPNDDEADVINKSRLCKELGEGKYENDDSEESRKLKVAGAWIKLRDSVLIGRSDYRFDEDQLWYHYTKDPKYLLY